MGVSSLMKATLVVPRSELDDVLRELADFGWFHPSQPETRMPDPSIDDLSSRSYRLFLELDELVKELNIKLQPDLVETILKGYKEERESFTVEDWADFVARVEAEAKPIVQEMRELLNEVTSVRKKLSEDVVLHATLSLLSKISIDLKEMAKMKRFYAVFTVAPTKHVKELKRSLPEGLAIDTPISKSDSAVLIAGARADADKIEKVLRSFELKPFTIPERLPQNPSEACSVVERSIEELRRRLEESEGALEEGAQKVQQRLLTLREAAQTAYTVLNQMRKSGDLKRFAIVQGYVPKDRLEEFKAKESHRFSILEEVGHESEAPTLLKNKRFTRAFQNITLTQGPPKFGEIDPTPIITFVFPVFYGMMFADFGQGFVLFILGLLLYLRGDPSRKSWGTVFAAAGLSATIFGLIVGEAFGIHLSGIPGPIGEFFHKLQILEAAELSQETVLTILTAGILIGVVHITIGLVLDVVKGFREGDRLELLTLKIPSLLMYVFGLFFSLAFIASGFDFGTVLRRVNSAPTPLLSSIIPVPAWLVARITFPVVAGSIFVIVFGKAIAGFLGKYKEEKPFMAIILGLVEFLIRLVEFLANTVSYARLGILLLVHVSLMVLAKIALESGLMGIPAAFAWNIAVMLIEGLIVYIQALRLHLYEWFTKFYEGTGELFQKLVPETRYVEIRWKTSKLGS